LRFNFIDNGVAGTDSERCPYYGVNATKEYKAISKCDVVPLETNGKSGDGTYCAHWSEKCLVHELMTGTINYGGANPLSRVTVGALADLGYKELDYTATDTYTSSDLGSGCKCTRRGLSDRSIESIPLLRTAKTTKSDEHHRILSDELLQYANEKGLAFLRQDPVNVAAVVGGLFNKTRDCNSSDSDVALYVGNRMVSVLVQDGPTGDIFGVHVVNPDYNC
jgi:Leishmanolysin